MKTHGKILLGFCFFFLTALPSISQDFMLAEVITGNPHGSNSEVMYKWWVEVRRADALGGLLILHVVPKTLPNCQRNYQIGWRFSKDISTVRLGETINVEFTNLASGVPPGCYWDYTFNCPSKVTVNGRNGGGIGPSGLIYQRVQQDPTQFNRAHVFFTPNPGPVIEGDPQSHMRSDQVFYQRGRSYVQVGGPTQKTRDFARPASGGSFMIVLGDRGVRYHIVYLYTRGGNSQLPPKQGSVSLQNPTIRHNVRSEQGHYWMDIRVPGTIRNSQGKRIQLVIRFLDTKGNFLPANPNELTYKDTSGYAASGSPVFTVDSQQFDLSRIQLWMPYYALNLPNTGGQKVYNISLYAEAYLNNVSVGKSSVQSFTLKW